MDVNIIDFTKYEPLKVLRILQEKTFKVEIDTIAHLSLFGSENISYNINTFNEQRLRGDLQNIMQIELPIIHLYFLFQNGHSISLINSYDVINIYNLINQHIKNMYNVYTTRINSEDLPVQDLEELDALAQEILKNNSLRISNYEKQKLEERSLNNVYKSIGYKRGHYNKTKGIENPNISSIETDRVNRLSGFLRK